MVYVVITRNKQGQLAFFGNPEGYLSYTVAKDAADDCYEESVIGEGDTVADAKRNAKWKLAQSTKNGAELAHKNVRRDK